MKNILVNTVALFAFALTAEGAVNVRDFGAKGDGVTDDTAAILNGTSRGATGSFQ